MISATYYLTNLEDKAGVFEVDFAFYDNTKYNYTDFEGIDYDAVENELLWEYATMHANNLKNKIGAGETILFAPSVNKKNSSGIYWIYAKVTPPTRYVCENEVYNVTKNRTVMQEQMFKRNVTTAKSLWSIIIGSFFG